MTSSAQEHAQVQLQLKQTKQLNDELDTDNKRLKNEMEQKSFFEVFSLRQDKETADRKISEQAKTIKAHAEEIRRLEVRNRGLQTRLDKLQQYKTASQKAVSDLKAKRRSEMEAEFELLVSHWIEDADIIKRFRVF